MPRRARSFRSVLVVLLLVIPLTIGMLAVPTPSSATTNGCLEVQPPSEALDSSEAASIYRLYCAFFLRPPKDNGLRYWVGVAQSTSLESIASTFSSGPEFQNRYGPLVDVEFVDLVFGNVMGRQSADQGRVYWSGRLDGGMRRGTLMLNFSDSTEFKRRTATQPAGGDASDNANSSSDNSNSVYYANCTAVREAGAAPILRGEPGYGSHLDRDDDGTACE